MDRETTEKNAIRAKLVARLALMKRPELLVYAKAFHVPTNKSYNSNDKLRVEIVDAWNKLYEHLETDWPHFVTRPPLMFHYYPDSLACMDIKMLRTWCQIRSIHNSSKYRRDGLQKLINSVYKDRPHYSTLFPEDTISLSQTLPTQTTTIVPTQI